MYILLQASTGQPAHSATSNTTAVRLQTNGRQQRPPVTADNRDRRSWLRPHRVSHIRFLQLFAMKRIEVLFGEYSLWFVNIYIKIFASIRFNSLQNIRFEPKARLKNEIFASIRFNSLQNIRFEHQANLKDEIHFKIFASIRLCSDNSIDMHMQHWHDIVSFAIFASDHIRFASIHFYSLPIIFVSLLFASYHIRFASKFSNSFRIE